MELTVKCAGGEPRGPESGGLDARRAYKKILAPAAGAADALLRELGEVQAALTAMNGRAAAEVARLEAAQRRAQAPFMERHRALEKELLKLMAKEQAALFPGNSDKADLPHGVLLHSFAEHVKRVRSLTWEHLASLGYDEGIKIVKSVDWDVIENWPEEKLLAVGTERVRQEVFAYELKKAEGSKFKVQG